MYFYSDYSLLIYIRYKAALFRNNNPKSGSRIFGTENNFVIYEFTIDDF